MSFQGYDSFRIDPHTLPPEDIVFGSTVRMREVLKTVIRTSHTNFPVLIRGETGTGKDVVARYIHTFSSLRNGPFVKVNCAAIPVHLLESELFGFEKGAFSGAGESKPGLVELASGGTLFLDEIGDMHCSLQSKVLHLLQDGRYARVGGAEERRARVRIVCATNSDLEAAVHDGSFRADLFYRIDVITLRLSPLRDRREDIPHLCEYLRLKISRRLGVTAPALNETTVQLLQQLPWTGNIRELESWMTRLIVLGPSDALGYELARQTAAASAVTSQSLGVQLKQTSRESARAAERALILKQLEVNHWNRRKTSRDLNMSYRSLLYKLREAGVPSTRSRAAEFLKSNGPQGQGERNEGITD